MNVISMLTQFFRAISETMKWKNKEEERRNTPEFQQAEKDKQEQKHMDKVDKAIKDGKVDEVRKMISE